MRPTLPCLKGVGRELHLPAYRFGGKSDRVVELCGSNGCRIVRQADEIKIRVGGIHRLIVAGLSPVAEYRASFALSLGYEVIVSDLREEYLKGFHLPKAGVVPLLPALYISKFGCHGSTAVVAFTHGPKLDWKQ